MFDVEMSIHKLGGYTKEDVVTMLTDIQLEIEEVKTQSGFDEAWDGAVKQCSEIIKQKINLLKGDKE